MSITIPNVKNKRFLDEMKKIPIFENCEDASLDRLRANAEIKSYRPHQIVWQHRNPLDLSVVLKGTLAVSYTEGDVDAVNSLTFPKQLLGEFEWLGLTSRAMRLTTLSDTLILTTKEDDLKKIAAEYPENFYKNLCKSFESKMYYKNEIISLLSHMDVKDRLSYLLGRFYSEWKDVAPRLASDNAYEIDIFWSDKNLLSMLSTSFKTVKFKIADLIKEKKIKVVLYEGDNFDTGEEKDEEYFRAGAQIRNSNYVKFTVLDYSKLVAA